MGHKEYLLVAGGTLDWGFGSTEGAVGVFLIGIVHQGQVCREVNGCQGLLIEGTRRWNL